LNLENVHGHKMFLRMTLWLWTCETCSCNMLWMFLDSNMCSFFFFKPFVKTEHFAKLNISWKSNKQITSIWTAQKRMLAGILTYTLTGWAYHPTLT
jgi:hypothetical protein